MRKIMCLFVVCSAFCMDNQYSMDFFREVITRFHNACDNAEELMVVMYNAMRNGDIDSFENAREKIIFELSEAKGIAEMAIDMGDVLDTGDAYVKMETERACRRPGDLERAFQEKFGVPMFVKN